MPSLNSVTSGVSSDETTQGPLVSLENITKRFGVTTALDEASLYVRPGEVIGLVGPNGAGKSTLMKVLTGVHAPTSGQICFAGRTVNRLSQDDVSELGIACAYQDLSLCTNLSVFENFAMLNLEHSMIPSPGWRKRQRQEAKAVLEKYFPGSNIDVDLPVSRLSLAERQMVEISKALMSDHLKLLILDEPTSALSANRAEQLQKVVRAVAEVGVGVIYISHKLDEITVVSDRIVILREGTNHAEFPASEATAEGIVALMGGGVVEEEHQAPNMLTTETMLLIEGNAVRTSVLRDVDFEARAGEIVGISGLVGSGQPELLDSIFAAQRRPKNGASVRGKVAYVSGDRAKEGVFPLWSIRQNIVVSSVGVLAKLGIVSKGKTDELAERWYKRLDIRASGPDAPITSLSGGNQQKALIARALATGADVVLMNDPTAGVDIETKQEIYQLLQEACADGKTVILHSTEDREMEICDRVYVMRDGYVTAELSGPSISVAEVVEASFISPPPREETGQRWGMFSAVVQSRMTLPIFAMILMFVLNAIANPNVLSQSGLRLLLGTAVPLVFAALGQMFIVVTGDIDMGNGFSIGLANVLVAFLLTQSAIVGIGSLLLLIAAYALMGGLIVVRRLPAIVVTLGAQFVWLGIALMISPVPGGSVPAWLGSLYGFRLGPIPMSAILCVLGGLFSWFVLFRWKYGIILRGVGNNRDAVERSGWSFLVGKMTNYGLAGLFVVFAGMAFTAVTYSSDANASAAFCMMSIATVIVGGCYMAGGVVEPIGVVAAGIAMSLVTSLLIFVKIDSNLQLAVTGLIIIAVMAMRRLMTRKEGSNA